jgi:hypothetical protein
MPGPNETRPSEEGPVRALRATARYRLVRYAGQIAAMLNAPAVGVPPALSLRLTSTT